MTIYKLDIEFNDGNSDIIESIDFDYINEEYEEVIKESDCVWCQITEQIVYGGICQGENILKEYNK